MKIISHSFFILFLLFVIFSCEKIEPGTSKNPNFETYEQLKQNVDEHFFDYNYVSAFNFRLEEIHLRDLNSKEDIKTKQKSAIELYSPFIEEIRDFYRLNPAAQKNIEKKYGFPMWDRLVEVKLDDGELAVIPAANEESICIEAIIYVFKNKNGKLKFHYAERGKFDKYPVIAEKVNGKKYPDREFVISQFLYFDKAIFEYVDCDILDEYKDLTGINEDQLKSASTVECTVTIEQTTYDYYYGVYVGGSLVKFAYNYTEVVYDIDYYCTESYTSGSGGGGSFSGGGDGEDLDDFETVDGETAPVPKPCPGDPVISPTIALIAAGTLYSGSFDAIRTRYVDGVAETYRHNGIDIAGEIGDPVYAMFDGYVTVADDIDDSANGKYYRIESTVNRRKIQITMIHLNDLYFTEGSFVPAGAIIGEIGKTGNAYNVPNPHVHISVKEKINGVWSDYIDPVQFMSTKFDSNWNSIPCY